MEYGGYFELELNQKHEYHENAYRFNSARNAFLWLLLQKKTRIVYVPSFICPVIPDVLTKSQIPFAFYHVDKKCEIKELPPIIDEDDVILYVNYYGIKREYVKRITQTYKGHIIIDNAQAFFDLPFEETESFYSPRKFFGVPDGGYAYSKAHSTFYEKLQSDCSHSRFLHLLIRSDVDAQSGFNFFQQNEKLIDALPLMKMSKITNKLLGSIDYDLVRIKRRKNFEFLHTYLGGINQFPVEFTYLSDPLCYPLLLKNNDESRRIREKLLSNRVYVPYYWPQIYGALSEDEEQLKSILPLPIDQRLSIEEMFFISRLIIEDI